MGERDQQRYSTAREAGQAGELGPSERSEGDDVALPDAPGPKDDRRERDKTRRDIAEALAAFREACARQPRRYVQPLDVDRIVITSVNSPFAGQISPAVLADSIHSNVVPDEFAGHIGRFLGELSLTDILRFCDRHQIDAGSLARFVRAQRRRLALHRPDLDRHLDQLVPQNERTVR